MAHARRQKLARALSAHADITYQQALAWLAEHAADRLPRSTEGLVAVYEARTAAPAAIHVVPASEPVPGALVPVSSVQRTLSFVIRHSDVARCPHLVLSVAHFLPTGECAHAVATCPTCQGHGLLAAADGTEVACDRRTPGLAAGVPVCAGTGRWSGLRCENKPGA